MIICAGNSESFDFAIPIGIGLINSAINLTKICIEQKPNELIFVGTAGSYGKEKIGSICKSSNASNVEIGFFDKLSYTPLKNNNVSRETLEEILVNSSNFITKDTSTSKQFLENGHDIENMEFFSVIEVAKKFNIKAYGIFYITNFCNEFAHEDFIKNHEKAKLELKKYINKMIKK